MENRQSTTPQAIGQLIQPAFDPQMSPQTAIPADGRNGQFIKNFGRFERAGSTYHWKIFRPNREKLIGYSKPFEMAEKANKQELLLDCVRRLVGKGYIKDGMRIEFYRAYHESDDNQSIKIFTLYGTRFIPEPIVLAEAWLITFLKNIYSPPVHYYDPSAALFPTGGETEPPEGTVLIPNPNNQPSAKGAFDLSRSFRSEKALLDYTDKLTRDGHPQGRISDFYRQKIKAFHSS